MDIIVCIKQVPGTSNVKVDPVTGVLIRSGIESKMNPYDLYALELALQLKEENGGSVKVVTMGPPAAMSVLKEAIWMGADSGVLISDRKLGGADVLATAYTLSQAIEMMGHYDLVLCGKQTTDGDTAQVGAETAEFLHIPHTANVHSIKLSADKLSYVAGLDNKIINATVKIPCLLCAEGDINTPRLPSYKRKVETEKNEELIKVMCVDDLKDTNPKNYGLSGSATKVERIFPPEKLDDKQIVEGTTEEVCDTLFKMFENKKFI